MRKVSIEYIHKVKQGKRVTIVSSEECSFVKYYNRPRTLKDIAISLENIAECMRLAFEDSDYDPFGFTYNVSLMKTVKSYLNILNPQAKEQFINNISDDKSRK